MYKLTKYDAIFRESDNTTIPTDPDNSDYQAYLKWVADGGIPDPVDQPTLTDLANLKLTEINQKGEAMAAILTAGYPEFEIKTWPQQETESMAWNADNTSPTPMIDIMATARGIPRELYLSKTVAKVTIFREKSSNLVGQRQKYSDQVAAATTPEQIAAINPVFSLA